MIPCIQAYIWSWHTWPAQKEATSCTRFYVKDWRSIEKIFYSNPFELILLYGFLRCYLYMFKISCRAEVVTSPCRSVTATPGLTSAGCHLTRLASDLSWMRQKYHCTVHKYVCTVHIQAAYDTHIKIQGGCIRESFDLLQYHAYFGDWKGFSY